VRVYDVGERLRDDVDRLPDIDPQKVRVAVQGSCHLRHVRRGEAAPASPNKLLMRAGVHAPRSSASAQRNSGSVTIIPQKR